jgi:hypothetical protein
MVSNFAVMTKPSEVLDMTGSRETTAGVQDPGYQLLGELGVAMRSTTTW